MARTASKPAQFSELVLDADQNKRLDELIAAICQQAHKHEVQRWRDAEGTDEEKLKRILGMAREALHLIRKPNAEINQKPYEHDAARNTITEIERLLDTLRQHVMSVKQ